MEVMLCGDGYSWVGSIGGLRSLGVGTCVE